jgi:hypothetical protein
MRRKIFIILFTFLVIGALSGSVFASSDPTSSSWWFQAVENGGGHPATVSLTITDSNQSGDLWYNTKAPSDTKWAGFKQIFDTQHGASISVSSGSLLDFNFNNHGDYLNLNSAKYTLDSVNQVTITWPNASHTTTIVLGDSNSSISAVPIPPSALLLGSGLLGLVGVGLRRQRQVG